jgi:hypothetical protein
VKPSKFAIDCPKPNLRIGLAFLAVPFCLCFGCIVVGRTCVAGSLQKDAREHEALHFDWRPTALREIVKSPLERGVLAGFQILLLRL